jgi:sigma-B regulation protein RsbU (phosphoserine phosphatase)
MQRAIPCATGRGEGITRTDTQQLDKIGEMRRHLLPRPIAQPPGWQLAPYNSLDAWAGGDFYDFFPLGNGRYLLFVADASGHGALAAASIVMARVLIHSCPLSSGCERTPFCPVNARAVAAVDEVLVHLNRVLHENTLDEQFMTAFLGFLEPAEGVLEFAVAGHPLPCWWQARTQHLGRIANWGGLPLGIEAGAVYPACRLVMEPNDVMAFFSDGLTEARGPRQATFGRARLEAVVRAHAEHSALEIQNAVIADLDRFQEGEPSQDDVTLMILKRGV